ncbi:beta-barrel assembly-enhancing protease [Thalassotalea profundi]|uniref:beta-barrel assembly-enhancing protease n=1 Tax=Thalassotalea profundi TaxID=2036687 RepID=UPI001E57F658|nr:M48 family metalloprotease [Thalassotalea profundi]
MLNYKNLSYFFFIGCFVVGALTASSYSWAASADKNKLPQIGTSGFSVLSVDKERLIGTAMMQQIRARGGIINDPVLIEYINHLGNSLVKNANDVNYSFEFFIVNNQELNAFAFFGGHIGIHSGLITTADTESELASVIAHEISHVTQRHLARRIEAQSRTQPLTLAGIVSGVLLTMINPAVGMAALSTSMAASQQFGINYTRGNEKEADRVGITLLAHSGFDPLGAPNFFNKMLEKYRYTSKPPAMLLTHPLPESRVSEARIRAQNFPKISVAPKLDFELAKARIKARYEGDPEYNINHFSSAISKGQYAFLAAARYGLALSYFEDKAYDKALAILNDLLQEDANNLFYIDALSDVLIALKQFKQAEKMLATVNWLMPNNQVAALNYANVLLEMGNLDASAQVLQDFLLVSPDSFIAYDLLTTVYRKQDKKALMHVSKAQVMALVGAYTQAIDELQTAMTYADDLPIISKRIKGRILQLQDQQEKLKRLN